MIKFILKTVGLVVFITTLSLQIQAANIFVDWQATGANTGNDWSNAYTSLNTAITNANAGDLIYVAQGTYSTNNGFPFILKDGVRLYGGCASAGIIPDPYRAILRNPSNYPTIISSGIGNTAIRINNNLGAGTRLDGFQIRGSSNNGIGIRIFSGTTINVALTVNNCTFNGGGAYGVELFLSSILAHTITPHFINCTFTDLTAGVRFNIGGNIGNASNSIQPKFTKCEFHDLTNSVQMEMSNGSLEPRFEFCRFYDNTGYVITNPGDGVYINNNNVCFCSNTYTYNPVFVNSLFYNNNGIADLLVGVVNQGGDLSLDIINCTLWNNSIETSPSINVRSGSCYSMNNYQGRENILKIQNSILWNNDDVSGTWMSLSRGMEADLEFSLVDATSCADGVNLIQTAALNCDPTNVIFNQSPQFVSTSTSTPNLRLTAFSPARNQGQNTFKPMDIDTDLHGFARIIENTIDMGAYEYCPGGTPCYPKTTIDPSDPDPIGPTPTLSLRQTKQQVMDKHIQITTYPNPVKGTITVKTGHQIKVNTLQLMTIDGKVIKGNVRSHQLDVQNVPKGLYLLKVQTDYGTQVLRVVKE
ncbi:MAG TPA: hypothetical protein DCS93_41520 [Microscillaceae bacterium]|nr:hypothetical protein [Microscillaceae bacterium]